MTLTKKQVLVLGANFDCYGGALYQKDIINELKKLYHIYEATPTTDIFETSEIFSNFLAQIDFKPDYIILNHSWLSDKTNSEISIFTKNPICIRLNCPLAIFLNKEYTNLNEKISYINKSTSINLVFTHFQHVQSLNLNKKTVFVPFAVSRDRIPVHVGKLAHRQNLLHFSGILFNRYTRHSHFRLSAQERIYYCLGNFPLFLKLKYLGKRISWHPLFTSVILNKLINLIPGRKRLSEADYFSALSNSIFVLCPASPLNLISTRLFEAISAGSIPLLETCADIALIDSDMATILSKYEISSVRFDLDRLLDQVGLNIKTLEYDSYLLTKLVRDKHTWSNRISLIDNCLRNL
jgi:hypothetical protein